MPASSQQPDKFKVDRLSSVTLQIQQLVEKAKRLGMGRQILDVLESIVEKLETNPMDWGDPEYATKQPGGVVLHGVHFPLIVHYAAFEQERVVCILDIRAFPRHALE